MRIRHVGLWTAPPVIDLCVRRRWRIGHGACLTRARYGIRGHDVDLPLLKLLNRTYHDYIAIRCRVQGTNWVGVLPAHLAVPELDAVLVEAHQMEMGAGLDAIIVDRKAVPRDRKNRRCSLPPPRNCT